MATDAEDTIRDAVVSPPTNETLSKDTEAEEPTKFTPEEEAELFSESQSLKSEANTLFPTQPRLALETYQQALSVLPTYTFHFPRAVLNSNIAAAHIRLDEWPEAIKAASGAIDTLVELESTLPPEEKKGEEEDVEEEIVSSGAETAARVKSEQESSLKEDILRIKTKSLLRRARARSEAGGWHNLSSAQTDYQTLSAAPYTLTPSDGRTVRQALRELPPRVKVAQEKEMGEMWGKLKDLGNGILKPFGLSTENFKMVQDEKTGGYSMNFQGGQ